ncbi:ROK family protein [Terribacillus sp. 179-K 1B1 HS]|uniref:ROK family transcriptional regulator n=1 Tax=Terribacillus sp. 179-K 1B1 HS TaxID=3142388 RepID=UPI00399F48B1
MDDQMTMQEQVKTNIVRGIRRLLLEHHRMSKAEIAEALSISFPTASKFIEEMVNRGEVLSLGLTPSAGGRRARSYAYNPNFAHALLIYLEKEETKYVITDANNEKILEDTAESLLKHDPSLLAAFFKTKLAEDPSIKTIAMGIPGAVNGDVISYIPDYSLYANQNIKAISNLPVDITIENDMNAAVLGYQKRNGLSLEASVVYIYMGANGPGAGILINGELVKGHTMFSGEISFIPLNDDSRVITKSDFDKDDEKSISLVSKLIQTISALLNPSHIVFHQGEASEEFLNKASENLKRYFPNDHLPELYISDWDKDYKEGLWELAKLNLIRLDINS